MDNVLRMLCSLVTSSGSLRPPLSAELLFDLETRLAKPAFRGVPIGSTLGDLCSIQLLQGIVSLRTRDIASVITHHVYRRFRPIYLRQSARCLEPRRVLSTWLGNKERLNQLLLPVIHALDPAECLVVGMTSDMRAVLDTKAAFMIWDECVVNQQVWRKEYVRNAPFWHRAVKEWLEAHSLTPRLFPLLAQAMLIQSQKIVACEWLLDTVQPSVILTEYDRNANSSCLVLAAKARRIPSVTLVHGTINPPYGYTPLLADIACCWGEQQREQMMAMGTRPERLAVTGCPRLSRLVSVSVSAARLKAGIPVDRPVVMLASNPIGEVQRRNFVRAFGQALAGCPSVTGVVRLHPSEQLSFYADEQRQFPSLCFSENAQLALDEALAAADLVVTHNSGLGNDALLKGGLTVIFDVLDIPLMNGLSLVDRAGCPHVRTPADLAATITRILGDADYRNRLRQQAVRYSVWFCSAHGQDAAQATADVIKKHSRSPINA